MNSILTYQEIFKEFAITYGPILVILIIVLVIGKFILGKVNFELSKILEGRPPFRKTAKFLSKNNISTFSNAWKDYFSRKGNKTYFFASFIGATLLMISSAKAIAFNALRPGYVMYDPIMELLDPIDFSKTIFYLEYSCIILIVFYMADKPANFVKAIWTMGALFWIRTITIALIPLNAPEGMIHLKDPFTQYFFGEDVLVTNDLFFSGHVSILTFFFLITENRYLKIYFTIATLIVGFLLIWQRVHYTTDVIFAPIFCFAVYEAIYNEKLKLWILEKKNQLEKAD